MDRKDFRIVFMGTPEFATGSLKALVENGYNIAGVVTVPDKPAGRGQKLIESDVKKYAVSKQIPVLQPEKLKSEDFLNQLRALKPDLQVVVAFRMLPEVVWSLPTHGTFNLHASLLPQYRGAAPVNRAVMNGEKKSGVTTFFIDEKIDTGEIIQQKAVSITDDMNAGELHDLLMETGAELVIETVQSIIDGTVKTQPQGSYFSDETELKSAPKIFRDDCKIDWDQQGHKIYNHIRGLSPYPAAWTQLRFDDESKNTSAKIYKSVFQPDTQSKPGQLVTDNKTYLKIGCRDGWISIKEIQLAGKKRMPVEDLLRGYHFEHAVAE
ncbi:methionyl-tRNA formyltransferase [Saccharicrinis sp. FJH54]|uniref:methionyl-tRNA formyltransferase n=1 Tax=Saccharicrinis sp. FJH54 TaxID=3344665 RepID=UPI0035D4CFF6